MNCDFINSRQEEMFQIIMDSQVINGIIHHPKMRTTCIVVISHGLNGDRVDAHRILVKYARECTKRGICVVRFDFRGCGLSSGEFEHSTIQTRREDLISVVMKMRSLYKGVPLILHGFSDGCRVIHDCIDQLSPDGILFWSPIICPSQAMDQSLNDTEWEKNDLAKCVVKPFLGLWLGFRYVAESLRLKRRTSFPCDVHIIIGDKDRTILDSIDYMRTCTSAETIVINESGHIFDTHLAESEVIENSIDWIQCNFILEGSISLT